MRYQIVHHNAGALKNEQYNAVSARAALVAWHGSERGVLTLADGTPVVRYCLAGDASVVIHEYTAVRIGGK